MKRLRATTAAIGLTILFALGAASAQAQTSPPGEETKTTPAERATATPNRPNFVVLLANDVAYEDVGANGHPTIRTPNLDRLAADGMRFENAFLTCSSCSPSRCSLTTGRYPHATGAMRLHEPLPADQILFFEPLRAAGYYTASSGVWHMGGPCKSKLDLVEEKQGRWVDVLRERPKDRPFCLWFGFEDAHRPYAPNAIAEPHAPSDVVVPPYLTDTPELRGDLALYYDEIARIDENVGKILAELDAQGLTSSTVVLFLSDNGVSLPRAKTTVYDSGVRTPLFIKWPARIEAKSVCRSLVSAVDLAPTILDLAGVETPKSFQGTSFAETLHDPRLTTREYVFAEHNWHDFEDHGRAVRSTKYKYIENAWPETPGTPPADAVRSPTFAALRRQRDAGTLPDHLQRQLFTAPRPKYELYDVQTDPAELKNLANDPAHQDALHVLQKELQQWRQATRDFIPAERRPDGFDRETGEPVSSPRSRERR
ncbi:MAG TPA: sulfatase [Pirellulales bacterium]